MGFAGNERLLLKVCQLAYRRRLSHTAIAENLGISRFQVARLLEKALDEGYVRFNILEPQGWHSDLETQLEEEFGLKAAIVVDGEGVDEGSQRHQKPGRRVGSPRMPDIRNAALEAGVSVTTMSRVRRPFDLVKRWSCGCQGRSQS